MEKLTQLLALNLYEEPWVSILKVLLFSMAIMMTINMFMKMVNKGRRFFSNWINVAVIVTIFGILFYFLYTEYKKDLKIVTFTTHQTQYDIDEDIWFNIEVNKMVYAYIYTYNDEGTKKLLYPKKLSDKNILSANTLNEVGSFNVLQEDDNKKVYKDEPVMLIVATQPIKEAKKEMSSESFSKMLGGNANTTVHVVNKKKERKFSKINIKIRKPKEKITVETQSSSYMVDEDIDLDINALNDGYVWVFEGTPTKNIKKLTSGKIDKNRRFPTGTIAHEPVGYHTAVAIYTKDNHPIEAEDFEIVERASIKGEPTFELKFKSDKSYTYDIETFKITQ